MITSEVVAPAGSPPVRVVRVDRPERRIAIDTATAEALHDAFVAFESGDEAVAVLAGGPEAFCSGADLKDLPRLRPSGRRWGVPLVDGGTYRLPRVIGLSRALDLILTGREVDSDEALAMGLVSRVVDDGTALDAAVEVAASIAGFPQTCVVADRASVYDGMGRTEAEALVREDERGRAVILGPDFAAGVERFTGR